jgi:uncharacterized protein (TIGR03435 family)
MRTRLHNSIVIGLIATASWRLDLKAQAPVTPPPAGLAFDVDSVKPNTSAGLAASMGMTPTGVTLINLTLERLMLQAFGLEDFQIIGGPNWLRSDRFDVIAKAAEGSTPSRVEINQMLQQLLIERFKLVIRRETKQSPIYALTVVKAGALGERLRQSAVDCASPDTPAAVRRDRAQCDLRYGYESIEARGMPLTLLTESLASHVRRPIVDRTGLKGGFDFSIQYNRAGAPDSPHPSIFGAFEEQLGLKLESTTGPVDVLTIDKAEHPTPN